MPWRLCKRGGKRRGGRAEIEPFVLRAQLEVNLVEEMDAAGDLDGVLLLVGCRGNRWRAGARAVETLLLELAFADVAGVDLESVERRGRVVRDRLPAGFCVPVASSVVVTVASNPLDGQRADRQRQGSRKREANGVYGIMEGAMFAAKSALAQARSRI